MAGNLNNFPGVAAAHVKLWRPLHPHHEYTHPTTSFHGTQEANFLYAAVIQPIQMTSQLLPTITNTPRLLLTPPPQCKFFTKTIPPPSPTVGQNQLTGCPVYINRKSIIDSRAVFYTTPAKLVL